MKRMSAPMKLGPLSTSSHSLWPVVFIFKYDLYNLIWEKVMTEMGTLKIKEEKR